MRHFHCLRSERKISAQSQLIGIVYAVRRIFYLKETINLKIRIQLYICIPVYTYKYGIYNNNYRYSLY